LSVKLNKNHVIILLSWIQVDADNPQPFIFKNLILNILQLHESSPKVQKHEVKPEKFKRTESNG